MLGHDSPVGSTLQQRGSSLEHQPGGIVVASLEHRPRFVEPSDVEQGAGYIESHLNVNGRSVEQRETYGEGVLGTTMADEDGELLCGDPVVIGSGPRRGRGACEEPPSGVEGAGRG